MTIPGPARLANVPPEALWRFTAEQLPVGLREDGGRRNPAVGQR